MTTAHPVFGTRILGRTYTPRPGAYVILDDKDGRIALVSTPQGMFLPGGGKDPGETDEETVRREAAEECGLVVETTSELGRADHYLWSPKEQEFYCKECSFFTGRVVGETQAVEDDHEVVWRFPRETWTLLPASQRWAVQKYAGPNEGPAASTLGPAASTVGPAASTERTVSTHSMNQAENVHVRLATAADSDRLARVHPDVFDHTPDERWTREFLEDPRHHLAIAIEGETRSGFTLGSYEAVLAAGHESGPDQIVGMASAVHYVHPDKPPELWINEVGVARTHQGQGLGRQLVETLLAQAKTLGIQTAWVLTDPENHPAHRLYESTQGKKEPAILYTFTLK